MLGKNPKRAQELNDGLSLFVQEIFPTLQGEGPFTGHPAVFVRLKGCNLSCFWCDTDFESSNWIASLDEILADIDKKCSPTCDLVVITGGEPFRQNISALVKSLLDRGKRVQIETNGTLWVELPEHPNLTIVCSPKTSNLNKELERRIDYYKYVIEAGGNCTKDGLPLRSTQSNSNEQKIARPPKDAFVYVMPLDSFDTRKNLENQKECIEIAKEFNYKFTMQTHKVLNIR